MNRGLGNGLRRRARMRAPKVRRAPRLRVDADNEAATTPAIRRSSQPAAMPSRSGAAALSAAAMGIGTTTKGRVRTPTHSALLFAFISLNREAARAELDVHAFGLMAVLIKLITLYGDGDRKRADL